MPSVLRAARDLLAYTIWANRIQLAAFDQVDAADLVRDTGASHRSLAGTMAHVLGAERLWLSRFLGNPLDHLPGEGEDPDIGGLRSGFEEFWPELEFFMASLQEDVLAAELTWENSHGEVRTQPMWQPLLHMVNHDSYHRGQITTMLRQLGYQPPSTDLVAFFAAR